MTKNKINKFIDYKRFNSAGEFYQEYKGRVPIQMMWGIEKYQKENDLTFSEAFEDLVEKKIIILL